ncbi:MAG: fatty acyl-AMP ligase, partial [Planctomycetes bacterium]|nr:fatty acyl-AMP ligase [Planctomycetota bacterium]
MLYAFLDRHGNTVESYTYAEFLRRTTDIAAHIQSAARLEPGERVLLLYPPGLEMICAFFACVRLGLIPVPAYPPTGRGFQGALAKLNFIARDCSASAVLTERSYFWSMKLNQARNQAAVLSSRGDPFARMQWIVSNDAEKNVSTTIPEAHSDILFLQYTSGSTSNPKGVMVTHENLLENCDAVVDHQPVGVSWLPQYHDMGLIGYYLFFALKGGTTYGFSPLDFIQRPALWLETISRVGATATSAPNFAYEYCLLRTEKLPPETFENLDLSSLRFLMTAAEPVRAQVYRDFIARFEPHGLDPDSFFSAYGLAEFTLAVSNYGRTGQAFDAERLTENEAVAVSAPAGDMQTRSLVSCGEPLGNTEVKIVDIKDDFKELPEGAIGEIWINGPSKCRGYWNRPELSRAIFEAKLQGAGEESPTWLRSGDLGFLHDGELYICGRTKDLIIVRGLNYYPQDVEMIVEQDPAIRKSCVAAFARDHEGREQLVVVAELRNDRRLPDAALLNSKLHQALGIGADQFVYIRAKTIPKTSSGKISRHQARERWLAGTLELIGEARQGEPRSAAETFSSKSEAAPVGPFGALFHRYGLTGEETGTLGDVGLDSLRIAEFAHDLKAELEVRGNDDLSGAVDLRLLIKIAVSELFELLEDVASAAPRAKLRFKRTVLKLQREHQNIEARMMRADTRLRFEPSELLAAAAPQEASRGAILLTGGTGF